MVPMGLSYLNSPTFLSYAYGYFDCCVCSNCIPIQEFKFRLMFTELIVIVILENANFSGL